MRRAVSFTSIGLRMEQKATFSTRKRRGSVDSLRCVWYKSYVKAILSMASGEHLVPVSIRRCAGTATKFGCSISHAVLLTRPNRYLISTTIEVGIVMTEILYFNYTLVTFPRI